MRRYNIVPKNITRVLVIVFLCAAIVFSTVETATFVSSNNGAQALVSKFGYIGILVISILAGVNIFVPVPAATFTPIFIAAGLSMPHIILLLIVGTTIADIAGYTVGRLSKDFASERYPKTYNRIFYMRQQHHKLLLPLVFAYAAFIPFPNEAFLIPLALVGVRLRTFIIPLVLGTAINQILLVYGIQNIFSIFSG